ncbi:hypothetical protein, partial [Listeria monocytogenes]|uniref:hypothetical protein n=1 Tax=Listeria monocytogenes TaxID=1639 RepID=UPI002FDC3802
MVIDGQGNSLPILAPGWNGIPFSTNQIGKHTVVAEWANFVASTTFTIAEPTPQPKPEPKPEPKPNTKTVDTANLNKAISEI